MDGAFNRLGFAAVSHRHDRKRPGGHRGIVNAGGHPYALARGGIVSPPVTVRTGGGHGPTDGGRAHGNRGRVVHTRTTGGRVVRAHVRRPRGGPPATRNGPIGCGAEDTNATTNTPRRPGSIGVAATNGGDGDSRSMAQPENPVMPTLCIDWNDHPCGRRRSRDPISRRRRSVTS
jgi:hypothetical protein